MSDPLIPVETLIRGAYGYFGVPSYVAAGALWEQTDPLTVAAAEALVAGFAFEVAEQTLGDPGDYPIPVVLTSEVGAAGGVAELGANGLVLDTAAQLKYQPPVQSVTPTVATVTAGSFFTGTYADTEDVIVKMPATTQTSEVQINGGRHVRIIGGAFKPAAGQTGAALRVTGQTGSIFLEGVSIDMSTQTAPSDALNACGRQTNDAKAPTYPDVYIQNCRITGVHGQNSTNHSDIYQPQGPIGRLFVDNFTGDTNYQGFFLPPQQAITSAAFSRVNLGYNALTPSDPTTYVLWLLDNATETPYPVRLSEVYVQPRAGQTVDHDGVYPASSVANIGNYVLEDGTVTWPATMSVSGVVTPGPPPAGDFVPAGAAGLGYVSPGYQQPASANTPFRAASSVPWDDFSIVTTFDFREAAGAGAMASANQARGGRVKIPKTGILHDVAIGVGTASGNIDVGIYDVGQGGGTVRNRLWHTGAIACPAAAGNELGIVGDPALQVYEGQILEFWISIDNTAAQIYRSATAAIALPASYPAPPGALGAPNAFAPIQGTAHPLPATIPGTLNAGGTLPLIAARIA